jgi:transcriptional regulator with XRE-family HTH domain
MSSGSKRLGPVRKGGDDKNIHEICVLKGAELKRLRRLRGTSQSELAKKIGYDSRETIRQWEKGSWWPGLPVEHMLCRVLHVSEDHFVEVVRKGAVDRESTALAEEISELAQELAGAGDREGLHAALEGLRRKQRLNPPAAKRAAGEE